jgi:hypothetical protein
MNDQLVHLEEAAPKAEETTVLESEETAKVESEDNTPLSPEERTLLQETEKVIEIGLDQFLAVGQALSKIKASKLYREIGTFEEYCQARWNLGSSYAYRLIESADCVAVLKEKADTSGYTLFPANESQVRELVRLKKPSRQVTAWKRAVKAAKGNAVTAEVVAKVVNGMLGKTGTKESAKSTKKGAERQLKSIGSLVSKELAKAKDLKPNLRKLLQKILELTGMQEKSAK